MHLRLLALAATLALVSTACIVHTRRTVVVRENPNRPIDRPTTTTADPDPDPRPDPAPGTFDPVAVGVAFDGVLRTDGSLATYYYDPGTGSVEAKPAVMFGFAGDAYFEGDETAICWVFGTFSPPPLVSGFPTVEGVPLRAAYDDLVVLELQDCAGKVDPAVWGQNAELLYAPFDGARVGIGFGPLTPFLEGAWTADQLATLGPSMQAEYVALLDGSGEFVGHDWTTALFFQWDAVTGELTQDDAGDLLPVVVPAEGPLPEAYIRSFPWWFEDLADLDLEALTP